jgi:tRNA pseudouridine38-40 synthase
VRTQGAGTRWFVQFGYDGHPFAGWARQPGQRTVEGDLRRGLVRSATVPDIDGARLEVASRTDRGVSARANVLALTSPLPGPALLRALNGIAPEIYFTAAAPVPLSSHPRHARRRWYRYFEPREDHDLARWKEGAQVLTGRIDVRSFGRDLSSRGPVWRSIDEVTVRRSRSWLIIDLRAPSFVWGMVRKIIAALRALDEGTLSVAELSEAVQGRRRLALPLAEPDFLVLWKVDTGRRWTVRAVRPGRRQLAYFGDQQRLVTTRARILPELWPARPDPGP